MMWTSHDTVGFVFLAGFCVQFGFSLEGKNRIVSSVLSQCHGVGIAALHDGSCSVGESVQSAQPFWGGKEGEEAGGKLERFKVDSSKHIKGERERLKPRRLRFSTGDDGKKMQLVIVWNQVVAHDAGWRKRLFLFVLHPLS